MKRALVLIVAVSVIACSDRRSPTSPTRPTGSAGTPVGTITHVLRGTVTNGAGTPVAGATVEWTGVAEAWGDRGHGVQTNEKGEYRIDIDALPPQGGRSHVPARTATLRL